EVRENLVTLLRELRAVDPRPRWVRAENLHVTLKFIGHTAPERLEAIRGALFRARDARLPRARLFPQRKAAARVLGGDGLFAESRADCRGHRDESRKNRDSARAAGVFASFDAGAV